MFRAKQALAIMYFIPEVGDRDNIDLSLLGRGFILLGSAPPVKPLRLVYILPKYLL